MFDDRREAGRKLAQPLEDVDLVDPLILALPRGGVPVAYEIAQRLDAPLDVFVVRKLGAPDQPEFGIGAIAEGGGAVIDDATCRALRIGSTELEAIAKAERAELERRVDQYRGGRPLPPLGDRDVVIVDDGLATGVTARAAALALRDRHPRRLILAVPVGAPETVASLTRHGVEVVSLAQPMSFDSVGSFYARFDQVTDEEVIALLGAARDAPRDEPEDERH